ncbi:hypothetical protein HPB50_000262 [Hyalomma asiaticum]|uniref:Uncharacterized protein n=1 Tax=Hyalomma asiaticum TaxID=266040 RepID=A0ACB7S494_HYAAI|nr:hypothetical protein HPB50_000262 [Hyalomma asiaticum]
MKSKKSASPKDDQAAATKATHNSGHRDLATLLHSTPSRRTRALRKAQKPSSTGANGSSPPPAELHGLARPPLQLQVYSAPFFGRLPVHLMPPQRLPAAYATVGDVRSEGSEASASTTADAEAALMLPRKQTAEAALPCTYPALVALSQPRAALRYSEPSYEATATTTATTTSEWSAQHGVIPEAHNVRPDYGIAAVGPEPMVCMYQCTENMANEIVPMPDDFCDLVYYQLDERYTFLEWANSTCIRQLVLTASASKKQKYGITVYNTQGDESSEQLKTPAGVTQFIKLWKNNVKHHGLTFVSGTYGTLNTIARFNLKILGRFKSLQVAANSMTGQRGQRRYVLLGIQAWFANFSTERVALAAVLKKISTSQPVNLLVLYTHIWHWPTTQCIVSGPTILSNNLHVPLPAMDTTVELVNTADTPRYVTVLLSLSAVVSRFIMEPTWDNVAMYGGQCVDREAVPYSNVCSGTNVINPSTVPEANVAIAHVYKEDGTTLATYETADTIKSKVDYAYRYLGRRNFGWAVHYLIGGKLNDSCPQLGSSAQRRPSLCSLPPVQGTCRGFFPSFYFDSSSGTCREFIYGGCKGNANRFESFQQCTRVCG